MLSLRNNPNTRNLYGVELRSLADFQEAEKWALNSNEAKQFETFAFDSITELMEICLVEEKLKAKEEARKKNKNPDGFAPFNELNSEGMRVFRSLRDKTNKHIYAIAQQEKIKDVDGALINTASLPGKELLRAVPYIFDEVLQICRFQAQDGTPYNALRTRADAQNYAGDRSGKLDAWEAADIGNIINKILS